MARFPARTWESMASLELLDLWGNELSGARFPVELARLSGLEAIVARRQTKLSGQIPSTLGRFGQSLKSWSFPATSWKAQIPTELARTESIWNTCHSRTNELSGQIPMELGGPGRP